MLELRDKRYNDVRLVFDEPQHKYTDTLGNSYISTTTILHQYQPKFDKTYWLKKKSKELGISEKKLEKQWDTIRDEACDHLHHCHPDRGIRSDFWQFLFYRKKSHPVQCSHPQNLYQKVVIYWYGYHIRLPEFRT